MKRPKKIGLTNAYRNEENTQEVFQCLLALPLLPVADIDLAFKNVTAMVTEDTIEDPAGAVMPLRPQTVAYKKQQCADGVVVVVVVVEYIV